MASIQYNEQINVMGTRYNHLTVVSGVYTDLSKENKANRQVLCKCDCGKVVQRSLYATIKYHHFSCGCIRKKTIKGGDPKFKNISNFESIMKTWCPDMDNKYEKKLPIFSGVKGKEKIIGSTIVDTFIYNYWSRIMWVIDSSGYVKANLGKDNLNRLGLIKQKGKATHILLHRVVCGLPCDEYNRKDIVDHISGDKSDNRKCNLRITDSKGNNYNSGKYKINESSPYSTAFVGVKRIPKNRPENRYSATVRTDEKSFINLGNYPSAEIAAKVRDGYIYFSRGEFARLAFPWDFTPNFDKLT